MLAAKILVWIAVLGAAVVPALADLNATHARNPAWSPHARFHVVWQAVSYLALGAIASGVLWWPGPLGERPGIYLAAGICACVYGGFFVAVASRARYAGRLHDPNGYQPLRLRSGHQVDLNASLFALLVVVLTTGVALTLTSA